MCLLSSCASKADVPNLGLGSPLSCATTAVKRESSCEQAESAKFVSLCQWTSLQLCAPRRSWWVRDLVCRSQVAMQTCLRVQQRQLSSTEYLFQVALCNSQRSGVPQDSLSSHPQGWLADPQTSGCWDAAPGIWQGHDVMDRCLQPQISSEFVWYNCK